MDRARPGSNHHLLAEEQGIPLAVSLTGGNRNDVTQLLPLLTKVPSVAVLVGRPRQRPDVVPGDRGYDHDKYRRLVRALGIKPVITRHGVPHGQVEPGSTWARPCWGHIPRGHRPPAPSARLFDRGPGTQRTTDCRSHP
ncbi:transposase [Streptomyces wuyuanensis]|uniref:transposase n=1 Tax=Streptomyces wuyuanensis TaxID=1196353 RepID=UPI00341F6E1A